MKEIDGFYVPCEDEHVEPEEDSTNPCLGVMVNMVNQLAIFQSQEDVDKFHEGEIKQGMEPSKFKKCKITLYD